VTIVAFVVALFTQSSLTIESVNLFLALSYLGFFVTTFRYFAEIFSMRKIDPTNVTLVMLLTPLWSALFAYVFLDEVLSTQQYFGCLLILIGLLGVQLFRKERRLTVVEIE
jgi:drug/metabolite transporter (DMT)-like permease